MNFDPYSPEQFKSGKTARAIDLNNETGKIKALLDNMSARVLALPYGQVAPPVPSLVGNNGKVLGVVGGAFAYLTNDTAAIAQDVADAEAAAVAAASSAASAIAASTSMGRLASVFAPSPAAGVYSPPAGMVNPLGLDIVCDGKDYSFSSDPHRANDWTIGATGVTHIYVHTGTGADAADGLTLGTAWKSLDKVNASAPDGAIVHIKGKWVDFLAWSATNFSFGTRRIKLIGEADVTDVNPTGRMWCSGWRSTYDLAFMGWVADGAAWKSTAAVTLATVNGMADAKFADKNGIPRALKWVATAAECIATPGSFFHDGTTLWVRMFDARKPDIETGWMVATSFSGWNVQTDADFVCENMGFCYNAGAASASAFRFRPTTAFVDNNIRLALKGVIGICASGNAIETLDPKIETRVDCHGAWCYFDIHNYTSFITTGTQAQLQAAYELNCSGHDNGFGHRSNPTASSSNNISTSHRGKSTFRCGTTGYNCKNSFIADVHGCWSMVAGVHASRATSGGLFQNGFWFQRVGTEGAAGAKAILIGCSADADAPGGSKYHISNWNDSETAASLQEVEISNWVGQTNINVRAGTPLKNYSTGAVL